MSTRATIIANLQTALEAVKDKTSYPLQGVVVKPFVVNALTEDRDQTPLLMIEDTGRETLPVRGRDGYYRKWMFLIFRGYVRVDHEEDLHTEISDMQAFIEQFADSSPSLGSDVKELQLGEPENQFFQVQGTSNAALVLVPAVIIYRQQIGSP
jgi:hypothetical protein